MFITILTHEITFMILALVCALYFIITKTENHYKNHTELEKYNITKITDKGEVNIYKRGE